MKRPIALAALLVACQGAGTPADAGPVIEAGTQIATGVCSLIDAVDSSGAVRSICATVEEVAQIIAFILTLRSADAGAFASSSSSSCTPLPGTTFCATKDEISKAILYVVRVRSARLMVDGGAR